MTPATYAGLSAQARSPLWLLLGCLACSVAAWGLATSVTGESIFDGFDESYRGSSAAGLTVALLLTFTGSMLFYLWIRQIGANARLFGMWLVAASSAGWEFLLLVQWDDMSPEAKQGIALVALLLSCLTIIFFRRPLIVKMWRAGDLPMPIFAEVIWLVWLIGWGLLMIPVTNKIFHPDPVYYSGGIGFRYSTPLPWYTSLGPPLMGVAIIATMALALASTITQHVVIHASRRP